MTFKFNIVGDETADLPQAACGSDGDLELSDELAALGAKLSQQAANLSALYPPAPRKAAGQEVSLADRQAMRPAAMSNTGGHVGTRGFFYGPALAALLALAGVSFVFRTWTKSESPTDTVHPATLSGDDHLRTSARAFAVSHGPELLSPMVHVAPEPPSQTESPAAPEPAVFVHELTGPELEGCLDLLKSHDAASRLSI